MMSADTVARNTAQGDGASADAKHLAQSLDLGEALAGLLVGQGYATVAGIATAPLELLQAIGRLNYDTAVEMKARAEQHLAETPVAGNADQASENLSKSDIATRSPEGRGVAELQHGTTQPASTAAERMRLSRQRRRHGLRCITIELRAAEIDALVSRGLLDAEKRDDAAAISAALQSHLRALAETTT